jgi:histone demethylase JARID1
LLIKVSSFDAVMMGTECIMATLSGDPEPSIPPGFGPFVALALQGIQNNVKPGDAHSSSAQAAQCMEKDVEILEHGSAHGRSGTPASTSGTHSCRRSLRNRPPIDYSQFDLISDEESDVESAEKVSLVYPYFLYMCDYLNTYDMVLFS